MSKIINELSVTYDSIVRLQNKIDVLDVKCRTLELLLHKIVDEFDNDDLHRELIEISRHYLIAIESSTP